MSNIEKMDPEKFNV